MGCTGDGGRRLTLIPATSGGGDWVQADRGALPSQTPFLAGEQNAAYLAGEPVDDAQFVPLFAHALEHAGGYTPEEANRVAKTLLPDVLRYYPTRPASFPKNGRILTDDVSDYFLAILTNGKVIEDKVRPSRRFLGRVSILGSAARLAATREKRTPPKIGSRADGIGETKGKPVMGSGE